jgi:microcystin-dependent protein
MSDPFVGEIRVFPYPFTPMGWLRCEGQSLRVDQYQVLFAVIGYTYGGSGTSFNLPNLSGRAVIGAGQGPNLMARPIGQASGTDTVALKTQQLPPHRHTLNTCNLNGNSKSPEKLYLGTFADNWIYKENPDPATLVAMSGDSLVAAGNDVAHENRQPAMAVPFCIAMEGFFPVRP